MSIDWTQLIDDLREIMSLDEIAQSTLVQTDVLSKLQRGTIIEPTFTLGLLLLDLYYDHFGEESKKLLLSP